VANKIDKILFVVEMMGVEPMSCSLNRRWTTRLFNYSQLTNRRLITENQQYCS